MINIKVNNCYYKVPKSIELNSKVYEHQEHLGKGGNSSVECYVDSGSGDEYAFKIIPLEDYSDFHKREAKRAVTELRLLKILNHEHIVKFYGYKRIEITRTFKSRSHTVKALVIIMEKADCSLKEYICKNNIDYSEYSAQLVGLAKALNQINNRAIHRDLKPENILVVDTKWVISDFGLGFMLDGSSPDITNEGKAIGPRYWLSPEAFSRYIDIHEHRKDISFNSDIYQMCSIFWFVVNRKHPSGILSSSDFIGPHKLYKPIIKGLQHDASRRYVSTAEFAQTLEECIYEV